MYVRKAFVSAHVVLGGNKKYAYCHALFSVNQIVNVLCGKCGINIEKLFSCILSP